MTVVAFPPSRRPEGLPQNAEPAPIIILPVVRIERNPDRPHDGFGDESTSGTGRRRRRSRVDAEALKD